VPEEIDQDKAKHRVSMLFNLTGRLSVKDQQRASNCKGLVRCSLDHSCCMLYSFVLLKIHGQDRSVYFLAVHSVDWPRGVDTCLSSSQCHPSSDVNEESESHGARSNDG
jgi:hypothetical protein